MQRLQDYGSHIFMLAIGIVAALFYQGSFMHGNQPAPEYMALLQETANLREAYLKSLEASPPPKTAVFTHAAVSTERARKIFGDSIGNSMRSTVHASTQSNTAQHEESSSNHLMEQRIAVLEKLLESAQANIEIFRKELAQLNAKAEQTSDQILRVGIDVGVLTAKAERIKEEDEKSQQELELMKRDLSKLNTDVQALNIHVVNSAEISSAVQALQSTDKETRELLSELIKGFESLRAAVKDLADLVYS